MPTSTRPWSPLHADGRCGMGEGTQHARDVAQRRLIAAAHLKWAHRLAFDIDDEYVAAGDQDLPEMEVAVQAGAHRVNALWEQGIDSLEQRGAACARAPLPGAGSRLGLVASPTRELPAWRAYDDSPASLRPTAPTVSPGRSNASPRRSSGDICADTASICVTKCPPIAVDTLVHLGGHDRRRSPINKDGKTRRSPPRQPPTRH